MDRRFQGLNATVLFSSPTVKIVDVFCSPGRQARSDVEIEPAHGLTFPRAGVYIHETPDGRVVVDPTVAIFRNQGDEQTTTHPTTGGDRNTELQFPAHLVNPLLDSHGRFRLRSVPISDSVFFRHCRLLARLRSESGQYLEIEEEALALFHLTHHLEPSTARLDRHRSVIEDARQFLAERFHENTDIATVANRVGSSPFHLSRIFKQATGTSMTAYRTALRLRWTMDRIAGGAEDLGQVAVEAGFYDQAHMTNSFRRRIGQTPSTVRTWLTS